MPRADEEPHEQILSLELLLLDPAVRRSPQELDRLLADDFFEIGSSGRMFENKARIIASLAEESGVRFSMHDFETRALGEGVVLATYRVVARTGDEEPRSSLRSSIWVLRETWQLVFHQGTPERAEASSAPTPPIIEGVTTLPPGFAALLAESNAEGFRFLVRLEAEAQLETPPFLAPDGCLLAAWSGRRLVGICALYRDPFLGDPQVGRLRHLYVAAEARRQGIGRRLVEEALRHGQRYRRIRLRTDSHEAAAFYFAIGFSTTLESEATHEWRNALTS